MWSSYLLRGGQQLFFCTMIRKKRQSRYQMILLLTIVFLTYRRKTDLYRRLDSKDPSSADILGLNKPSKSLFMQNLVPLGFSYMDRDDSQKEGCGSSCSTWVGNKVVACSSCSPWDRAYMDSSLLETVAVA
jgi:hypothetical protein